MELLGLVYTFRGEEEVAAYLAKYPFLPSVLWDIAWHLYDYFPEGRLFLEVSHDPEMGTGGQVLISVSTDLEKREALDALSRFDHDWWLDALPRAQGKICVGLEFV